MIRFLHEGTRLYTHTTRAYKIFTNEKELLKWHKGTFEIDFSDNGSFEISGEGADRTIKSVGTVFGSFEREALINLVWRDDYCFANEATDVEIRIMSATSETEYCTEIHVLHKNLSHLSEEETNNYKIFWKGILEDIRKSVNGDWIIKDSELTLDCFK